MPGATTNMDTGPRDTILVGLDLEMGFDSDKFWAECGEGSEGAKEPELDEDDAGEEGESEDTVGVLEEEVDDIDHFLDMFTEAYMPEAALPMSVRPRRNRAEDDEERPVRRQAI